MMILYRSIPIALILISSIFFYLSGFFAFPDIFQMNFLPNNHVWDEVVFYFHSNFEQVSFDSYSFFPKVFNTLLLFFVPYEYFPLFLNLIVTGLLLLVLATIGKNFFLFDGVYNIVFVVVFSITLGWGVTTYLQWFEIISISKLSDPLLYRQNSPSLVMALFLLGLYLIYWGAQKKVWIQIFGLSLTIFTYPFYTVFVFIFTGLLFSTNVKLIKLKRFRVLILFFIAFVLLWFYVSPENSNTDYRFMNGLTYTTEWNVKLLLMNGFFIAIGVYFFRIADQQEKKVIYFLLVGIVSGLVAIHSHIILGYEVQSYHWDMYLLRPLQWMLVLYLAYIRIFRYRHLEKVFLLTWVFSILFSVTTFVSAKSLYSENFKPLKNQLNLIKSYQSLNLYISNGESYTTLDPLLILMSKSILPHANIDMPFSGHMKRPSSEKMLEYFIRSLCIHRIAPNEVSEIFNADFASYLGRDKVFNYILFGMDFNDGIYHALSNNKEINSKNIDLHITNQYQSLKCFFYENSIVINKLQFNDAKVDRILQGRQIAYEDDYIVVTKSILKDANDVQ